MDCHNPPFVQVSRSLKRCDHTPSCERTWLGNYFIFFISTTNCDWLFCKPPFQFLFLANVELWSHLQPVWSTWQMLNLYHTLGLFDVLDKCWVMLSNFRPLWFWVVIKTSVTQDSLIYLKSVSSCDYPSGLCDLQSWQFLSEYGLAILSFISWTEFLFL